MARNLKDAPKPSAASGIHTIKSQTIACKFSDFTDGGSTAGTLATSIVIPKDAVVLASAVKVPAGFASDTSATLKIGDGTDVDRYNTGTPSVFATAKDGVAMGIPSGAMVHTAAATVTLTVTGAADFTSIDAGQLIVTLYYV